MANHEPRQSPRKAIVKRLNLANKTYPMPMRASGATTYHRNPTHNRLLVLDGAWGGIAGATVFEFRMRASGDHHTKDRPITCIAAHGTGLLLRIIIYKCSVQIWKDTIFTATPNSTDRNDGGALGKEDS
ncbi:hypothetical protein VTN96DRAFT_1213 [Rasamsonia emersonii]